MKPRFRWRTEDDFEWPVEEETAVSRYGHWSLWLVILIVGLAFSLLYWQQMRRVRLVEQTIEQDVLAVHHTWLQAITTGDVELLAQLLSREDILWVASQRRQLVQGAMLDRLPMGLQALGEPAMTAVELAPDWQKAEVTLAQSYAGAGVTEPFLLEQIHTYAFDGNRWLQTPPDDEFWGEMQTFSGDRVAVVYPARDAEWGRRVGQMLDAELIETCLLEAACPDMAQIEVLFTTAPSILTTLRDELTPVFDGRAFLLPTPSLVGVPQDENGFLALYAGYSRRILNTFRNQLNSPLPLPSQDLLTLCFPPNGSAVNLFQYDTAVDGWSAELRNRAFSSISSWPNDDGVILQERFTGGDPTQLYLLRWQSDEETLLLDDSGSRWMYPPMGWAGMGPEPNLIVQGADPIQATTFYRRVNMRACDDSGCPVTDLPGYTVWSPDGRHTLVQIDSVLFLGDAAGRPYQELEAGFNPFWLEDAEFGYIRYVERGERTGMELVQTAVNAESPPQPMLSPSAIGEDDLSFYYYVAPNPTNPQQLFIAAPNREKGRGGYQIVSLAEDGTIELRLELKSNPIGYPLFLTPTGYPPFLFSPDGRYLVLTELVGESEKSWQFYLHEVATKETAVWDIAYPPYPARYPFYDWSADGRWLAIMDDGFVRLLAPDFDYERLVTYEYDACFFVSWVNR